MAKSLGRGRNTAQGESFMKLFEKSSQKEKKEHTPTQQKVKIALNWTVNVLCIILIIFVSQMYIGYLRYYHLMKQDRIC